MHEAVGIVSDERRGRFNVLNKTLTGLANCRRNKLIVGVATSVCQSNIELVSVSWLRRLIDLSVPGLLPEYGRLDEWALWIEVWVRALRDPDTAKDREVLDQRWRAQIAEIVRGGQASGEFSSTEDPDELSLRIAALIDGLAIQVALNDSLVTTERMHRTTMEVAAQTLGFELEPASP